MSVARLPVVRVSPVVDGSRIRRLLLLLLWWSKVEGSVVLCVVVVVRVVVGVVLVVATVVLWWWRLRWIELCVSRVTVPVVGGDCRGFSGRLGPTSVRPGMSHWNMYHVVFVCVMFEVISC